MAAPLVLAVGKFLPAHRGHAHLLDAALRVAGKAGRLHVFVNDRPTYTIPAEVRVAWVQEEYPAARVHFAPDPYAADDSDGQTQSILRILGRAPDVIVTSETWGDAVAARLGCRHVQIDPPRVAVPISATMIRTDPIGNWAMLMPAAKAGLCRRICLVGAESTGKTTLAEALAGRWGSSWVPEVGRDYTLEKKAAGTNDEWTSDDFIAIAERQQRLEDHRARRSGPVMACDTDALTTAIWHERYQGHRSPVVDALAARRHYDLFVLCGTDVPWEADDIRIDGASARDRMQHQICEELARRRQREDV